MKFNKDNIYFDFDATKYCVKDVKYIDYYDEGRHRFSIKYNLIDLTTGREILPSDNLWDNNDFCITFDNATQELV